MVKSFFAASSCKSGFFSAAIAQSSGISMKGIPAFSSPDLMLLMVAVDMILLALQVHNRTDFSLGFRIFYPFY